MSLLKWRDIRHFLKLPVASFTIEADTFFFLCPRIRGQDFDVKTANDFDIKKWFREHGRGNLHISYIPLRAGWINPYRTSVTVWFTDKDTAMRAKLTWGGR